MTPRYITVKGGGISAASPFYIGHVQHDRLAKANCDIIPSSENDWEWKEEEK